MVTDLGLWTLDPPGTWLKNFGAMPPGGGAPINREDFSGGAEPRLTSGGEAVAWVR